MGVPKGRLALFAATAGVIVMTVRSVAQKPPPLWFSATAFIAYSALILSGVLVLRFRVFADAIVQGPEGARGIALTFDDGPDPVTTPEVLDALDRANAKATFFVIARKAKEHPDLVRSIAARGHAVGLHSFAHDRLFSLRSESRVRADLEAGMATLGEILGARPSLFRPPIGHTNPIIVRVAEDFDLTIVGWSVSARDGLGRAKPNEVAARVRRGMRDGAIVLMHDAAERSDFAPAGPKALPEVLADARERGLELVRLEPWIAALDAG